jgi:hypothetical protein
MNEIIVQSGIDKNIVIMVLMLPIVATLIGFVRHILGFKTLGIYLSLILTFILVQIGFENNNGNVFNALKYGIPLIVAVFLSSLLWYLPFKKWALHYYPKLSFVITGVTVVVLSLIIVSGLANLSNFIKLNAFILIMIVGITEKYFIMLARKNISTTLFVSFESLVIAIFCYFLVSWEAFQNLLLNYPYLILLLFPINYLIGKFTGLRLSEYLRFWNILIDKD